MKPSDLLVQAEGIFRNYGNIIVIGLLFIFLILFISTLAKRKDKLTENRNIFDELTGEMEVKKKKKLEEEASAGYFPIEEFLFEMLHIKPDRKIVNILRIIIVIGCTCIGFIFHYLAIYFIFEAFMFFASKSKEKQVEDDNGLSYIDNTNRFLDLYIPSVNNGMAVNQIMNRFVEAEKDEVLLRWWYLDDEDKKENIPKAWDQVIRIYYSGIYNEENGFQDSAENFQHDLIQHVTFYNNFKEKIGEINPIKGCYYIFMPVILLISYGNDPDFWSTGLGLADVLLLCFLMWLFTTLLGKIHKDTCELLF